MNRSDVRPFAAIVGIVAIAALVALAGSQGGETAGGVRVFALCAGISFVIQWAAFIPAYFARTEQFFDLTGSVTYITVAVVGVVAVGNWEPRSIILAVLIAVWAVRLGSFLFVTGPSLRR